MPFNDFYDKFASFLPTIPSGFISTCVEYIHERELDRCPSAASSSDSPRTRLLILVVDEVAKHLDHEAIIHELSILQDGIQNRFGFGICLIFTTLDSRPMNTAASRSNRPIQVHSLCVAACHFFSSSASCSTFRPRMIPSPLNSFFFV
jgi:hypothetical protein